MKKLVIHSCEKVWYDYELELSEQYVNDTNGWMRKYHKQVNGENIPFLDAEMLTDIWNNRGNLKFINIDREERGQELIENVEIINLSYPSEGAYDLFRYVYDMLIEDVWNSARKEVYSETDDYEMAATECED